MDEINYNEMTMRIFLERIHELEEATKNFQEAINEKNNYIRRLEDSLEATKEQIKLLERKNCKEK